MIGLNPYGLAYAAGLQAAGTPGAHPHPLGLNGFLDFADELGAECIELDWRWLTPLAPDELRAVRLRVGARPLIYSHWLSHDAGETLTDAIERASALGACLLRLHLTPVLEGARARWGGRWPEMVGHARTVLARDLPRAADAGLPVGIENHQDFGSEELVALSESLGDHVGIVLDAGNPFAVGEDPVDFTRRAAHRIRHVHLKDYRAQFTGEGYRLVRCAIGDGCVPFDEMLAIVGEHGRCQTASLEPGALEARHIRLFTSEWWHGYPPRDGREVASMIGRLRVRALPDDADYRTPWEREAAPDEIAAYEIDQVRRSMQHVRRVTLRA